MVRLEPRDDPEPAAFLARRDRVLERILDQRLQDQRRHQARIGRFGHLELEAQLLAAIADTRRGRYASAEDSLSAVFWAAQAEGL